MGCWNATCAFTHLPILDGEPCYAMLAVPRGLDCQSTRHACGFYAPLTPLIYGNYDGYGRLEAVEHDPALCDLITRIRLYTDTELLPELTAENFRGVLERIMTYADRCELNVQLADGRESTEQRVVLLLFKKHFVDVLVEKSACCPSYYESPDSITFRLAVRGPLREDLRQFGTHAAKESMAHLFSFVSGMDAMRAILTPQCGSGSQDALYKPWQIDLYKDMETYAEAASKGEIIYD